MYTIIFFAIIGFFVAAYVTRENKEEFREWNDLFMRFLILFLWFLQSILGATIGITIGVLIATALPAELSTKTDIERLATIQDGNSVNGSFFLGCGQIEGRMKYTYYIEENGFYKMKQLDYENVLIKYDTVSYIEQIHKYVDTEKSLMNKFAIAKEKDKIIIHIPNGSIKQNYNLDAN